MALENKPTTESKPVRTENERMPIDEALISEGLRLLNASPEELNRSAENLFEKLKLPPAKPSE